MSNSNCNTGGGKQIRDNKSIYHPSWKSGSGKGDQPRQVTKQYEENYTEVFPNSFKPSWQTELEKQQSTKST
tara:strand:+ start:199 stop:414 length:216 start_codon:yes stop_codon:yes gene_type:complete